MYYLMLKFNKCYVMLCPWLPNPAKNLERFEQKPFMTTTVKVGSENSILQQYNRTVIVLSR